MAFKSFLRTSFLLGLGLSSVALAEQKPSSSIPSESSLKTAPSEPVLKPESATAPALSQPVSEGAKPDLSSHKDELVFLLVDKNKLTAELLTWPEDPKASERLISFRIAIGKQEGDKQKRGDNKTPEGIYFAEKIIDGRTLPAKYGPAAIPIDFPNPLDRFQGKTGSGIWLHGVEKDNRIDEEKVTEGCVAFYNSDIMSLTQWLKPSQSIIVIAHDAAQVNRPEDVSKVKELVQGWTSAWNDRDLDRYMSYFIPTFRTFDRKMNLAKYKNYKRRVFASYTDMAVRMENVRVFTHDRYAVAIMNQDFQGDSRYRSYGRKILYWQRTDDGGWKLFHEEFDDKPMSLTSLARDKIAQIIRNSPSTKFLQDSRESKL